MKKGFTLIELLIVTVIIATLMGVVFRLAGMGGSASVMGVHIENTARHPSAIGVAVNVGCWSHRRGHIVFDRDLNVTCDTHSTFRC